MVETQYLDASYEAADRLAAGVGAQIRAARKVRGMTLAQLGGGYLSRSFLSAVERGRTRISLRALSIVAERLDVPLSALLAGAEEGPLAREIRGADEQTQLTCRIRVGEREPEDVVLELTIRGAVSVETASPPPRKAG